MAVTKVSLDNVSRQDNDNGHRTYTVDYIVLNDSDQDWPPTILGGAGLPQTGAPFLLGSDYDPWAICHPSVSCKMMDKKQGEYTTKWKVTKKFSTIPFSNQRCFNTDIQDPLAEPPDFSGSFVKYTKEQMFDKDGNLFVNSAHQLIEGAIVEFDNNKPQVNLKMNVINLNLGTWAEAVDTVSSTPMWGLPSARMVKLSDFTWDRILLGTCGFYYSLDMMFDVDFDTFDRIVPDEASKVLNGHWEETGWVLDDINEMPPDKDNPEHFIEAKDRNGENTTFFLDGNGEPVTDINLVDEITLDYYPETNFLSLGIPVTF